MKPSPIPNSRLKAPDPDRFFDLCNAPNNMIHFLVNVGDGDTQLVLLPKVGDEARRAVVVDVSGGQKAKLPGLVATLQQAGVLAPPKPTTAHLPTEKCSRLWWEPIPTTTTSGEWPTS